jgi:GT2 family glycosyltransferase
MIGIVLVNYKSINPTIQYVTQELSKLTTPFKLVIVNNACDDESNRALTEGVSGEFLDTPEAEIDPKNQTFIIGIAENLGYAKGNNLGVLFMQNHFPIEHVLMKNNDLEILQPEILDVRVEKLQTQGDVGMIGPKVVGLDG